MIITLVELPAVDTQSSEINIHDGMPYRAKKKTVTLNFSSGISFINEFEYGDEEGTYKFCEVVMIGGASEYVAVSKAELLERLGIQQITEEDLNSMRGSDLAVARRAFTEDELTEMKRRLKL